jgi:DNA-binding transcriptional MerR regulator
MKGVTNIYSIKEAATITELSEHTIRYYTDMGLVPSLIRDKNNRRVFNQTSINWLTGIKNLRETDMSLEAIKHYISLCLLGDSTIKERADIIQAQKEKALVKLAEAQKRVAYLEKKSNTYQELINQKIASNDPLNPATWEEEAVLRNRT